MARKAAAPATKATARKSDAVDPKHRWDRPIHAPDRPTSPNLDWRQMRSRPPSARTSGTSSTRSSAGFANTCVEAR